MLCESFHHLNSFQINLDVFKDVLTLLYLLVLGYSVMATISEGFHPSLILCNEPLMTKLVPWATKETLVAGPEERTQLLVPAGVCGHASVSTSTDSSAATHSVYGYGQHLSSPSLPVAKRL